jgi:hypothetical protein
MFEKLEINSKYSMTMFIACCIIFLISKPTNIPLFFISCIIGICITTYIVYLYKLKQDVK